MLRSPILCLKGMRVPHVPTFWPLLQEVGVFGVCTGISGCGI